MDLGFNIGNIRFISNWISLKKPEEINKLTQSNLIFYGIIGLINTLVMVLLGYFADRIFLVPKELALTLSHLLYLLSVTALITWIGSVFKQIIYAYEKIAWDQRLTLFSSIISFGAVLLAIKLQLSLEYYFLLNISTIIFPVPFWLFKSKKLAPFLNFKPKWHSLVFKPVLVYSIAIFAMGIFQFSVQNLRPIILGIRCNVTFVTDFSIIQQLASLVMLVGGSFITDSFKN
jgi:Na+-driven multidrug efflux pump